MDSDWLDKERARIAGLDDVIAAVAAGTPTTIRLACGIERPLTVDDVDDLQLARDVSALLLDGLERMAGAESSPAPDWAVRAVE